MTLSLMKIKCVLVLVFLCLFVSCSSKVELKFDETIDYFEKWHYDHFPREVPNWNMWVISQDVRRYHPHIWLKFTLGEKEIEALKNKLEAISIDKYNSRDSCLLVVDRHLTKMNYLSFDKTLYAQKVDYPSMGCTKDVLPVPNFYSELWEENPNTSTKLNPQYELYIIEAKRGEFLPTSKLPNGKYTPAGWEHGISKGIAVNERSREVIYWTDVW